MKRIWKAVRLLLFGLSAVLFAGLPAAAQKPRYALTATEHTNQKTGTSTYTQTLRNRRTGRVIWVRHFPGAFSITWSKDHKAVVFLTGVAKSERPQYAYNIKFGIWQENSRVRTFFTQPFIHADYVMNLYWSPNRKHLLIRAGNSGADSIDKGPYYCLNVDTRRVVDVGSASRRVQWIGNNQVKYWPVSDGNGHGNGFYESSKPRLWRLPKGF